MPETNTYFDFSLQISDADYQRYYSGSVQNIIVTTRQGIRVQFPASAVRPFVTDSGVHGKFKLVMNAYNKLVSLEKISD